METRWLIVGLLCPACPIVGCEALTSYRPLPVLVQDAETLKPIAGAEVQVAYARTEDCQPPPICRAKTSGDGIARLQTVPYGSSGPVVQVSAAGYMGESKYLTAEAIQAIEPVHHNDKADQRPIAMVVKLFADPEPTVELVLPNGYRGLVKAEVAIQADASFPPGQRCFRFEVPESGVVQVAGPCLLQRVFGTDFRARYADGTALVWQPQDSTVGWWWMKHDNNTQVFLVGTEMDFRYRCNDMQQEEGPARRSSGGQGSGGRHRRHGNPSPAAPAEN